MQSPKQYLSLEPCFARNGCTSFEIQGSKVCSTICPSLCATVLVSFKGTMYAKPQPVPFTGGVSLHCARTARALHAHCALLLDYVPPEEPPSTPLGNALRIR